MNSEEAESVFHQDRQTEKISERRHRPHLAFGKERREDRPGEAELSNGVLTVSLPVPVSEEGPPNPDRGGGMIKTKAA